MIWKDTEYVVPWSTFPGEWPQKVDRTSLLSTLRGETFFSTFLAALGFEEDEDGITFLDVDLRRGTTEASSYVVVLTAEVPSDEEKAGIIAVCKAHTPSTDTLDTIDAGTIAFYS